MRILLVFFIGFLSFFYFAQLIADLKGISLEEVATQTTNNAKKYLAFLVK